MKWAGRLRMLIEHQRSKVGRSHAAFVDGELPVSQREAEEIAQLAMREQLNSGKLVKAVGYVWFLSFMAIMAVMLGLQYPLWLSISLGLAWFVLTGIPIRILIQRRIASFFRTELRRRGFDICISCGYWLRGLSNETQQCPECGARLVRMPGA